MATSNTSKVLSEMEAGVAHHEMFPQWTPFIDPMWEPMRKSARFAAFIRGVCFEGRGIVK